MNPVVAQLRADIGKDRLSAWLPIDQDMIDRFERLVEASGRLKPSTGRAGAQPYLILSLLPKLLESAPFEPPKGVRFGVNYGMDHVRFPGSVRCGARVRGRFTFADAFEKRPGQIQLLTDVTVEIEGEASAALTGKWITQAYT